MDKHTGLADRARFEAFSRQWRDTALEEAGLHCSDARSGQLLADIVLTEIRKQYARTDPPRDMEYEIREKINAVFKLTGQDVQLLEQLLVRRAFPEDPAASGEEPAPAAQKKMRVTVAPRVGLASAALKKVHVPVALKPAPEPTAEEAAPEPVAEKPAPEPAAEKPGLTPPPPAD